ncbi:retinoic acid receptor responder protein 2 isoform X1 [Vulpes vulpes]|uniref:Retinoic acid receptor responder protein 2 n=1 Tax=Vulpes vulpes TaxID=9627 RepID=A0A3Q7S4J2_VULVU|nr:retinoic acid receptor responder protein 2 isoform X1 [Vulpes vulpes]
MWQLLIPLALWLGAVGLGRAELTAAQQRGLQVALEEFHKHPPVQWAFKETSVDRAEDTPFPAGTFVRLEFKLQQTSCRKKDWKKANCKIKPNGRKRKCLACIKLNSADKVLGRMVHCPILTQVHQGYAGTPLRGAPSTGILSPGTVCPLRLSSCLHWQEPEEHQEAQCSRVERAGEDPHSYYFPGQFAFFKAPPPS